jgi:hypothetical protein
MAEHRISGWAQTNLVLLTKTTLSLKNFSSGRIGGLTEKGRRRRL